MIGGFRGRVQSKNKTVTPNLATEGFKMLRRQIANDLHPKPSLATWYSYSKQVDNLDEGSKEGFSVSDRLGL
jgi:hypothetical protein